MLFVFTRIFSISFDSAKPPSQADIDARELRSWRELALSVRVTLIRLWVLFCHIRISNCFCVQTVVFERDARDPDRPLFVSGELVYSRTVLGKSNGGGLPHVIVINENGRTVYTLANLSSTVDGDVVRQRVGVELEPSQHCRLFVSMRDDNSVRRQIGDAFASEREMRERFAVFVFDVLFLKSRVRLR